MKGKSLSKGMMSFDALFSLLPLILMSVFVMDMMLSIGHSIEERSQEEEVFDKLVSIADYTVKAGAVMKDGSVRYPNWIDEERLTASYIEDLRERMGLSELYISTDGPDGYQTCIYRIIVTGGEKRISRLFVCGG